MDYTLREYQKEAIESVYKAFRHGINKQVAVLATGLGKTIIFSHIISDRVHETGKKALILAHREELLHQAQEKLHAVNPSLKIGLEQADNTADHAHDQVVIASVATIGRNLERLQKLHPDEYSTIIIDEAHHASAYTYKQVMQHFGVLKNSEFDTRRNILLLGVTATPNRTDNKGIDEIFDEVVFRYDIIEGIQHAWLSRINAVKVDTETDIEDIETTAGDFNLEQLDAKINTQRRNALVVQTYQDVAKDKQTLIFAASVAHTKALYEEFQKKGIKTAYVTGESDKKEREESLKKFAESEIHVMINAMVLTEGYDNASIEFVFMTRPTKSGILYQQMIGRGTRRFPGKEKLMIVDFVDNTTTHALQTAASLLGLEGKINFHGEDILDAKDKLDLLLDKRPFYRLDNLDMKNIDYVLHEVDLMQEAKDARSHETYSWHKLGNAFRMNLNHNRYFLIEQSLTGQYILSERSNNNSRSLEVGSFASRAEAIKFSQTQIVTDYSGGNADTPWKNDLPTEAQIALLRELGVSEKSILFMSKGQASEMISRLKRSR